jgi:RimJ/RimL family protein N-acetyltransferase
VYEDISGNSQGYLEMRLANFLDSQQLLAWRNHSSVRQFSKNRSLISPTSHEVWLKAKLESVNQESRIFIFSNSNNDVGMTRLDMSNKYSAEISIIVDPAFQKMGFGSKILLQSIQHAFNDLELFALEAFIHVENLASFALFSKMGFVKVRNDENFDSFLLLRNN